MKESRTVQVYATNWKQYLAGEPVGDWLLLPATKEQVAGEVQHLGGSYRIHDMKLPKKLQFLQECIVETTSLEDLNLVVAQLSGLDTWQLEAVELYCSQKYQQSANLLPLCNLVSQSNQLPFSMYGTKASSASNVYEKLGLTLLEERGKLMQLEAMGMTPYINAGAYGLDCAKKEGLLPGPTGYLYQGELGGLETRYSRADLERQVEDLLESPTQVEQSVIEAPGMEERDSLELENPGKRL